MNVREVSMSDLEITRLAAEAMGYTVTGTHWGGLPLMTREQGIYSPLTDDAQAMALVKKFHLMVNWNSETEVWCMPMNQAKYGHLSDSPNCADLNRTIVECVANIQSKKP